MGRFGRYCDVAASKAQPMAKRCKSFCHAIERYASLTNTRFASVLSELELRHRFRIGSAIESARLVAAVDELRRARSDFLVHRQSVIAQRRLEKRNRGHASSAWWLAKMQAGVALGQLLAPLPSPAVPTEDPAAVERGAAPPELPLGASVRVVVNSRNKTPRSGQVERRVWHFKLQRWTYFLRQGSRRVSKRYFAEDLELSQLGPSSGARVG